MYILDVCNTGGEFKVIEINPFSGADLYSCDCEAIVHAVEGILLGREGQQTNLQDRGGALFFRETSRRGLLFNAFCI